MKTLAKSEFKAKMLEIMRNIEATGDEVVITDHGKPCIVVGPYRQKRDVRAVFSDIAGQLVLHEDPDLPTTDEWNDA
jgi:prevent-host-death family protein